MSIEPIRLTQYSHGAGCGCKISPQVLEEILAGSLVIPDNDKLLVGNHSKDDAAVYDLGNGSALISTTDFFMPIVDDPFDFGRIAAANAISDVYAMGGKPILSIAILGWPVKILPAGIAKKVIEGARSMCLEAGIPLAGGHSIDAPEPIFGLAVNGLIPISNIKKNNAAEVGDLIFLTKKIGVGILTTAEKRGSLQEEHIGLAKKQMVELNKIGEELGKLACITAMTDITGFGLGGHLVELAEGSGKSAEIDWLKIPLITDLSYYISKRVFPDGTNRNWNSYGSKIGFENKDMDDNSFIVLADPQTNGGLLITVKESGMKEFKEVMNTFGLNNFLESIGRITEKSEKAVIIR